MFEKKRLFVVVILLLLFPFIGITCRSEPETSANEVVAGPLVSAPSLQDPILTLAHSWRMSGAGTGDHFGFAGTFCDVDGNGNDDLFVVSERYGTGELEGQGNIEQIGLNDLGLLSEDRDNILWSYGTKQAEAGMTQVGCADFNGDLYEDLIASSQLYDYHGVDSGALYVFNGSPEGLSDEPDWIAFGDAGNGLGYRIDGADFTGDGFDDLLVSALYRNGGQTYVLPGSAIGLPVLSNNEWQTAEPVWSYTSKSSIYGGTMYSAGDVNGDGKSDILIIESVVNRVSLFYGVSEGDSGVSVTEPGWEMPSEYVPQLSRLWGGRGIGDVNGDGYADVALADIEAEGGFGTVTIFTGSPEGLNTEAFWTTTGTATGIYYGAQLAGGDLNGDGYGDLVVVSERGIGSYDNHPAEGTFATYMGLEDNTLAETIAATFETNKSNAWINALATGDLNGDGATDIFIGSSSFDADNKTDSGQAYVFMGVPVSPEASVEIAIEGLGMSYAFVGNSLVITPTITAGTNVTYLVHVEPYGGAETYSLAEGSVEHATEVPWAVTIRATNSVGYSEESFVILPDD